MLHARGLLGVNETFQHRSITGGTFECYIRELIRDRGYEAVLPAVKQIALVRLAVGDQWRVSGVSTIPNRNTRNTFQ